MWRVNIYIQIENAQQRQAKRKFAYVIECVGKSGTTRQDRETGQIEGTYHSTTLFAMNRALKRLNQSCEVHIYTEDRFICNAFEHFISAWAAKEWKNSRGTDVENRAQWEELWKYTRGQLVKMELGQHKYTKELAEIMKEENENV